MDEIRNYKTEITIETRSVTIIRNGSSGTEIEACPNCGHEVGLGAQFADHLRRSAITASTVRKDRK